MLVLGLLLPFVVGERRTGPATEVATGDFGTFDSPAGDAASSTTVPEGTGEAAVPGDAGSPTTSAIPGTDGGPGASGPTPTTTPASSAPSTTGGAAAPRTASDVGVTADEIKLGILIPDLGGLSDAGFGLSGGDQELHWQTFAAEVNDAGGINGRMLNLVIETFDPLSENDMQAKCVAMGEEHKVFAVLNVGGFYGNPVRCLTETYGLPFLGGDGEPTQWYQNSGGLFYSLSKSKTRALQDMVGELDRYQMLAGKNIGILDNEFPNDKLAVDTGLIPALDHFGYSYHRETLSQDGKESAVAVQQMQSKDIDVVLLATNFVQATTFVQQADAQGYTPMYVTTDFAQGATDFYAGRMPDSFEGSVAFTSWRTGEWRVGAAEDPAAVNCRQRYESGSGATITRGESEYGFVMLECTLMDLFTRAAGADVDLQRTDLGPQLQGLGQFAIPGTAGASYGPGKADAADMVRPLRWKADCTCWMPEGRFQPGRF